MILIERRGKLLGFGQNASELFPNFTSIPFDYTYELLHVDCRFSMGSAGARARVERRSRETRETRAA